MEGIKAPIFSFSILTFIYFLAVSSICTLASSQTDTLSRNEKIGIGQTLVSSNKVFQLGFFTPGNSQNRYFGIFSEDYTVWVADRENPLSANSATLTIQDDGNLAVITGGGYIFWSTDVSIASNTTTAVLLDTGNLVLKEGNPRDSGRYIWQSFDHPTHALLPGMKVGINLRTKQTQTLKSWKNDNDPTPGNFEFGIDVDGLKQFFIYRRSIPHVRAVFWNGSAYDDTSRWFGHSFEFNYSVADSETEVYFTISHSSSAIHMLVMTPEGFLSYVKNQSSYISTRGWIGESDVCSVPGGCGEYSTCNVNNRPVCKCLPGFEKDEYNKCIRKTGVKCSGDDGLLVLKRVEMSEPPTYYTATEDEGECRERCLSSRCDCKAYAFFSNQRMFFNNKSRCTIWEDELKVIHEEEHTQEELVVGIPVAASDLIAGTLSSTFMLLNYNCHSFGLNVG
ncbi:hypothetical protein MRB53_014037 [Persea americana]|uniref:Uncharacterized protein n=1 Tax=Persea americana TaxID=3435 RepID=A0ACC2K9T0_PERAE|nr:hypothetical protein MRB53_014037 [Persea americana]